MSRIRLNSSTIVTIALNGNLSTVIPFSEFAGGVIHMPAAWTAASIGFTVSSSADGTFLPLYDGAIPVQISSPAVNKAYPIPDKLFGARFVKLWSQNGSGTLTAQAAARAIIVDLKA